MVSMKDKNEASMHHTDNSDLLFSSVTLGSLFSVGQVDDQMVLKWPSLQDEIMGIVSTVTDEDTSFSRDRESNHTHSDQLKTRQIYFCLNYLTILMYFTKTFYNWL